MNTALFFSLVLAALSSTIQALQKRFILRFDDVQDFFCSQAQQDVINFAMDNGYGITAGIIGDAFNGADAPLYAVLQRCAAMSRDKCAFFNHGRDAAYYYGQAPSAADALAQLQVCDNKIKSFFNGYVTEVMVPHQNSWSQNLLDALNMAGGYNVVSASVAPYSAMPWDLTKLPLQMPQQADTANYDGNGNYVATPQATTVAKCENAAAAGQVCVIMMHPMEYDSGDYSIAMLQSLINTLIANGFTSTNFHTVAMEALATMNNIPTAAPTIILSATDSPSATPTAVPTTMPSLPLDTPTEMPSLFPTVSPTEVPSQGPPVPTNTPTTPRPTVILTASPTVTHTNLPTRSPSTVPLSSQPTFILSKSPTWVPTLAPTVHLITNSSTTACTTGSNCNSSSSNDMSTAELIGIMIAIIIGFTIIAGGFVYFYTDHSHSNSQMNRNSQLNRNTNKNNSNRLIVTGNNKQDVFTSASSKHTDIEASAGTVAIAEEGTSPSLSSSPSWKLHSLMSRSSKHSLFDAKARAEELLVNDSAANDSAIILDVVTAEDDVQDGDILLGEEEETYHDDEENHV